MRIGLVLILAGTTLMAGAIESAHGATEASGMWVWSFGNAATTVKFA